MYSFRSFRNTDVPKLVEIWRDQPIMACVLQDISAQHFEQYVLAKPYFDRHGLIVATNAQDDVLGFVHAGFGPNSSHDDIDRGNGVICALMVSAAVPNADALRRQLLASALAYLDRSQSRTVYGGGISPASPFYFGLYGGCQALGVLHDDGSLAQMFREHGFHEHTNTQIWQRDIEGYRPAVDRNRMQLRREFVVETNHHPQPSSWWMACQLAFSQTVAFRLIEKSTGSVVGTAAFWDLQPFAKSWRAVSAGAVAFEIQPTYRGRGLGKYFLSEALKQLDAEQTQLVQFATNTEDAPATALLAGAQFERLTTATTYRKNLSS